MLELTLQLIPPEGITISELARATNSKYYSTYTRLHPLRAFKCVEVDNGQVYRGPNYEQCLKLLTGTLAPGTKEPKQERPGVVYALLSDIHIGRLTPEFNLAIIEEMASVYIARLEELKNEGYRIIGLGLGDYVDGGGIYPRQAYEQELDPNEQVEAFGEVFSDWFALVDSFYGIVGNHGRTNEEEHANLDYMALIAMKSKFGGKVSISPRYVEVFNVGDDVILLSHTPLKTYFGLPDYAIRRFVASHIIRRRDITMAALGHFHVPKYTYDVGIPVILNGSFLVEDELAKKLGLLTFPSQVMIIKQNGKINVEVLRLELYKEVLPERVSAK